MPDPQKTAAITSGGCYVVRFNKVINADNFISRAVPPDPFSALAVNVEEAARFRDRLNYERDRYLEAEERAKEGERLGRVWQARHRLALAGSEKNRFRAEDLEAKLADVTTELAEITERHEERAKKLCFAIGERDAALQQLAEARKALQATANKVITTTVERNAAMEDRDAARREVDEVVVPVSAPLDPAHKQVEPPLAFLDTVATAIYSQGGFTASQAYDGAHNLLNERYRRHQAAQETQ